MHNEHVYLYFRWKGWVAELSHRHWGAFFLRDFARQEREQQKGHPQKTEQSL